MNRLPNGFEHGINIMNESFEKKDNRIYGADIARIIAMLMVVVLHNLLNGGILKSNNVQLSNLTYWLIENLMIVAVNVFAMISGFLLVNSQFKWKRILGLWRTVFFWSAIPTLALMLVFKNINVTYLVKSFFPVLFKQYWYFNGYIVLFIVMPFLNVGFRSFSIKSLQKIILMLLILSGSVGILNNLFLEGGESALWLIIMYLIGALIRQGDFLNRMPSNKLLITIYVLCGVLSLCGEGLSINYIGHLSVWIQYNSPIVIVQSILLFIFFIRLRVKGLFIKKLLKKISPMTFAVYLADTNPYFYHELLHSSLKGVYQLELFLGVGILFLISIGMFFGIILLESIRRWILSEVKWFLTKISMSCN